MSLEQEQHSREPPRTVRLAAAQPTKRAEPNSYLRTQRQLVQQASAGKGGGIKAGHVVNLYSPGIGGGVGVEELIGHLCGVPRHRHQRAQACGRKRGVKKLKTMGGGVGGHFLTHRMLPK